MSFQKKTIEIPALNTGELLVKISYTTICRSDIYTFQGKRREKNPTILGHEITGHIVELGPEAPVQDLRGLPLIIGSRITWGIYASDPTSEYSKRGIPQKSHDLFKYGHEQITAESNLHGGLAEYIILRKNTPVIIVDEKVSDPVASLINCSVATVAGAMRMAGLIEDRIVMICGTGMLGTIACAMAKKMGAQKVLALDANYQRAITAMNFGADQIVVPNNNESQEFSLSIEDVKKKVDVVIDFTGIPEVIMSSFDAMNIGATIVLIGSTFPQTDLNINAEKIVRNIWTIKGLHNYNEQDLIHAVEFIEDTISTYQFSTLVGQEYSLDEVTNAYDYAISGNPHRVGVYPSKNNTDEQN
jgi:putative phosphonate catabolism associated alcohol dehydrogenase